MRKTETDLVEKEEPSESQEPAGLLAKIKPLPK
jgi:hypothetical protein